MNRIQLAAALLLVLAGSGCTAASSWMKYSAPTVPPAPDVAKVIFYRTPAYFGHKSGYDVWDGDKLAGVAENGGYFEYLCPPGRHLFHVIAPLLAGDACRHGHAGTAQPMPAVVAGRDEDKSTRRKHRWETLRSAVRSPGWSWKWLATA